MTETLLVASNNPAKRREIEELLAGCPYRLVGPHDLGIRATVEETGTTFRQNAVLKAEAYGALSGCLTLADDSGLVVDALDGEPGVRSARFGGAVDDAERCRLLLRRLDGVPARAARFVCVIAIAGPDGLIETFDGSCEGAIGLAPVAGGGFGYDPIFRPTGETRMMSELAPAEKHRISHRGRALAAARDWLVRRAGRREDP